MIQAKNLRPETRIMRRSHFLIQRVVLVAVVIAWAAMSLPATAKDPGPPGVPGPEFNTYWHDGKAELSGYQWTVIRYGQPRRGQAVMIYVTEPFSRSKQVKVDHPSRDPSDTFDALKLNLVRDFQTGIYDYNTMASLFVESRDFTPAKSTFTSAEWCGHVYEEILFEPGGMKQKLFSYFENESSSGALDHKAGGVLEDNLFILLRGLRGAFLKPGKKKTLPFLPSAFYRRLVHQPIQWTAAEIQRLADPQTVEVPAGTFATFVYVITTKKGREGRFYVEQDYPHRIVRWEWKPVSGGAGASRMEGSESGQLAGTARLKYWKLHGNEHERYLKQLGLGVKHPPGVGRDGPSAD